jgi:ABC-2 type transport system ATP-binding protein
MSANGAGPAIEAVGLVKEFERGRRTSWERLRREPDRRERFRAVDGIDLHVDRGEIFGVLGPNGAGKTTTMKMLATLLEPTVGSANVLGYDVVRDAREVRRRMGAVLSDGRSLYWKLTARENLEYFAALYHVPPTERVPRIAAALQAVKLADRSDDYVERYSTGMRQRLVLARALLPDPELLLLDEPTVGLDPQSRVRMWDEVRRLRGEGMTVFLTTHYLDEADALCDRIAIIDHGEIVAEDTPDNLKREIAGDVVRVGLNGETPTAAELLTGRPYVRKLEIEQDKGLRLYVDDGATAIPQILRVLDGEGISFGGMELTRPTLDDVFLTKTGRSLRER